MAEMNSSSTETSTDIYHVFYPAVINLMYSVSAFIVTIVLIPTTRDYFMQAGLKGKDMAKSDKREM